MQSTYQTGGGYHLLFGARAALTTRRGDGGHQGIAVMATGSCTILPPSGHAGGGAYRWIPAREPRQLPPRQEGRPDDASHHLAEGALPPAPAGGGATPGTPAFRSGVIG